MSAAPEKVLVLRVCLAGGRSPSDRANGFVWPRSGAVASPDWSAEPECGNGLHGWLWGEGDVRSCNGADEKEGAEWLVVEVLAEDIVQLDGKVKFPRGEVIFFGDRAEAVKLIAAAAPAGTKVIYGTATAGDAGTATAGDAGTATAGDAGTATAGYAGTATAGVRGTATAGEGGRIAISWWCGKRNRYRTMFAEVGFEGEPLEDGQLKPNTRYRVDVVDGKAQFVEIRSAESTASEPTSATDEAPQS